MAILFFPLVQPIRTSPSAPLCSGSCPEGAGSGCLTSDAAETGGTTHTLPANEKPRKNTRRAIKLSDMPHNDQLKCKQGGRGTAAGVRWDAIGGGGSEMKMNVENGFIVFLIILSRGSK